MVCLWLPPQRLHHHHHHHQYLLATSSNALVTSSDALVSGSFQLLVVVSLLLVVIPLILVMPLLLGRMPLLLVVSWNFPAFRTRFSPLVSPCGAVLCVLDDTGCAVCQVYTFLCDIYQLSYRSLLLLYVLLQQILYLQTHQNAVSFVRLHSMNKT